MQTAQQDSDIVVKASLKLDQTIRHTFIKAMQLARKPFSEVKMDEMLLNYRNHGVIPNEVTDYCISVMVGEPTEAPPKVGWGNA